MAYKATALATELPSRIPWIGMLTYSFHRFSSLSKADGMGADPIWQAWKACFCSARITAVGWPERIELSWAEPQSAVLPLNYSLSTRWGNWTRLLQIENLKSSPLDQSGISWMPDLNRRLRGMNSARLPSPPIHSYFPSLFQVPGLEEERTIRYCIKKVALVFIPKTTA